MILNKLVVVLAVLVMFFTPIVAFGGNSPLEGAWWGKYTPENPNFQGSDMELAVTNLADDTFNGILMIQVNPMYAKPYHNKPLPFAGKVLPGNVLSGKITVDGGEIVLSAELDKKKHLSGTIEGPGGKAKFYLGR